MTGAPGTAATAIKEGGRTQPLVTSLSFISSSKTESSRLFDVLERTFRFLFLVGSFTVVFIGAMVVLVTVFGVFTGLFLPKTGAFFFFSGDFFAFTSTFELLSLAFKTLHLVLLLPTFLGEDVLVEVRDGSLELEKGVSRLLGRLLLEDS